MSPTAAAFVVELALLIGALLIVAVVVLWILDRFGIVDMSEAGDAPHAGKPW